MLSPTASSPARSVGKADERSTSIQDRGRQPSGQADFSMHYEKPLSANGEAFIVVGALEVSSDVISFNTRHFAARGYAQQWTNPRRQCRMMLTLNKLVDSRRWRDGDSRAGPRQAGSIRRLLPLEISINTVQWSMDGSGHHTPALDARPKIRRRAERIAGDTAKAGEA